MITRDFEKFDRVTQAAVLSRILLMKGCRFDQQSILQRLAIDVELELSVADLCGLEAHLGLRVPAWEKARYEVKHWLKNPFVNLDYLEQMALTAPGLAGMRLGELLWKLGVTELPFQITQVWPSGRKGINVGAQAVLAVRTAGADNRTDIIRLAQKMIRRLNQVGLTPLMVADTLMPFDGAGPLVNEKLVQFRTRKPRKKIPRGTRLKLSSTG